MKRAARDGARAELLEIFEEISEDGSAVAWRSAIPYEAWHAADTGGTERIGRMEPSPRAVSQLRRLRDELGTWPVLSDGSSPEDDGSNVRWVPVAEFAPRYADWQSARVEKAAAEHERLLSLEIDETDMEVLARLCGPKPETGFRIWYPDLPSVAKLKAHGYARETGWAFFMVEPTEEGRELDERCGRLAPGR